MRSFSWPFAWHIAVLVLASAIPSAWVAAALAASLYRPDWQSALALTMGVIALVFGAGASFVLTRELDRMLADLASDARLLAQRLPLSRLQPVVREGAAIADALAAAAARHADSTTAEDAPLPSATVAVGEWRWDLVNGTMRWNVSAGRLLGLEAESVPSLSQLLTLVCSRDRAPLAAWLASLARGDAAKPWEFRLIAGDDTRRIRVAATLRQDENGTLTSISGTFVKLAAAAIFVEDATRDAA